ncbi:MAG TPA: efflux RND transporter periplasmic adaptor subunit, partial [Crenotrichaceae bacterium]|nr:efflux RND transporter periplasmic adaptor subunit [Crenotrichaceae bacterium]
VSLNHPVLGAQIAGKVHKIYVKTGDQVTRNRVLLDIDCRDYLLAKKQAEASLGSAKAQLLLASKQYQRNLQLRKIKTIPQNLLDESILQTQLARADIAVKKAAQEQADLAIERCKIKAPFAGQITQRFVSEGQLLAANSPVFKLLQSKAVEVSADLTITDVQSAKQAEHLWFTRGSVKTPVRFRAVVNEVTEGSRTVQARLVADKTNQTMIVGSTGRLEWLGVRSMLPAEYIIRRHGKLGVMLAEASDSAKKAVFHPLPDASEGQAAFIHLPGSSLVIVSNRYRIKPNQIIEIK